MTWWKISVKTFAWVWHPSCAKMSKTQCQKQLALIVSWCHSVVVVIRMVIGFTTWLIFLALFCSSPYREYQVSAKGNQMWPNWITQTSRGISSTSQQPTIQTFKTPNIFEVEKCFSVGKLISCPQQEHLPNPRKVKTPLLDMFWRFHLRFTKIQIIPIKHLMKNTVTAEIPTKKHHFWN